MASVYFDTNMASAAYNAETRRAREDVWTDERAMKAARTTQWRQVCARELARSEWRLRVAEAERIAFGS